MAYLWCDIYDPSYTNLVTGAQRINLIGAEVERVLDGPGTCRVEVPATDTRALALMLPRRVVEVWWDSDTGSGPRVLGAFVIEDDEYTDSSQQTRRVGGPDVLNLLRSKVTSWGVKYSQRDLDVIIDDQVNRDEPFTIEYVNYNSSTKYNTRFDGQTALSALKTIVKNLGVHFRLVASGAGVSKIQIGPFGAESSLRVVGLDGPAGLVDRNTQVTIIDSITITEQSDRIANRVYPRGGGSGDQFVTLFEAWLDDIIKNKPTNILRDYRTPAPASLMMYLEDVESQASYGVQEAQFVAKDIVAVTNSAADLTVASNALRTAALAELQRTAQPQVVYKISVKKLDVDVAPGDKVYVNYHGTVYRDGLVSPTRTVTGWFWVLSVQERIGSGGQSVTLQLSNVDRVSQGAEGVIVGALDAIELNGVIVQPYLSKTSFTYYETLDPTHPAVVPITITNATQSLQRCIVRVQTRPFRATAKSAASVTSQSGGAATTTSGSGGGVFTSTAADGSPRVLFGAGYSGSTPPVPSSKWVLLGEQSGGGTYLAYIPITPTPGNMYTVDPPAAHTHGINIPSHTHRINIPSHTHTIPSANLEYGIVDDTEYPGGLAVYLDGDDIGGNDRFTGVSSPWGDSNSPTEIEIEISQAINNQTTLQTRHDIEFRCTSGQGRIVVQVELYEVIQNLAVT